MKVFEVTISETGITIRREAEERLTADQKYNLLLAVLGVAGFLGFFWIMVTH